VSAHETVVVPSVRVRARPARNACKPAGCRGPATRRCIDRNGPSAFSGLFSTRRESATVASALSERATVTLRLPRPRQRDVPLGRRYPRHPRRRPCWFLMPWDNPEVPVEVRPRSVPELLLMLSSACPSSATGPAGRLGTEAVVSAQATSLREDAAVRTAPFFGSASTVRLAVSADERPSSSTLRCLPHEARRDRCSHHRAASSRVW
jgi:hypothetical protein